MTAALVLCSHGTKDPDGQEVIRRLTGAVRLATRTAVHHAVVDVEPQRLRTVLAGILRPVVVVPLLLSGGLHVHRDIAEAVTQHPSAIAASPLGPDWTLAEVGVARLAAAGVRRGDVVVMAASGSGDPRAMADVAEAGARLSALWGGPIDVGHVGHRGRPLPELVARARRRAASGQRVVVSSYLLAPGHFQDRVREAGADLVTDPLLRASIEPGLVGLVLQRYAEAADRLVPNHR